MCGARKQQAKKRGSPEEGYDDEVSIHASFHGESRGASPEEL